MPATADKIIWKDRKRYFGLPLSFTRYSISEDRLFVTTGCFNLNYEELMLYRVRDIHMKRTLSQRLFGVGTITIISSDKSASTLQIVNVKAPEAVKELIHQRVEDMKERRRFRFGEFDSVTDDFDDMDGA